MMPRGPSWTQRCGSTATSKTRSQVNSRDALSRAGGAARVGRGAGATSVVASGRSPDTRLGALRAAPPRSDSVTRGGASRRSGMPALVAFYCNTALAGAGFTQHLRLRLGQGGVNQLADATAGAGLVEKHELLGVEHREEIVPADRDPIGRQRAEGQTQDLRRALHVRGLRAALFGPGADTS